MSDRFVRLYTAPENQHIEGSPVLISAGALLKDNESGRILAQMKFCNIKKSVVRSIAVEITVFDNADRELEEKIKHTYMDLNLGCQGEGCDRQPIFLPAAARSFKVNVTEVVFNDKTIWTNTNENWESFGRQKTLLGYMSKELAEQYGLECGGSVKYLPEKHKNIWSCTCGAYNFNDSDRCTRCGLPIDKMNECLNKDFLEKNLKERLKKEAYQEGTELLNRGKEYSSVEDIKEAIACFNKSGIKDCKEKVQECEKLVEELEAKHKRNVKIGAIVAGSIIAVILIIVLCTEVIVPNVKYNNAGNLCKQGKFEEAMAIYVELEDFKDSPKMYFEAKLGGALQLVEAGQFEEGIEIMREMTAAKQRDCWGHINESNYKWGLSLYKDKYYEEAIKKFKTCGEIRDSLKYIPYCEAAMLADVEVTERYSLLKDIRGFLDVNKQLAGIEAVAKRALALKGSFETTVGEAKRKISVTGGKVYVYRYDDYWDEYDYYAALNVRYDKGTERFYYYWNSTNNYLIVDDSNNVTGQTQE